MSALEEKRETKTDEDWGEAALLFFLLNRAPLSLIFHTRLFLSLVLTN